MLDDLGPRCGALHRIRNEPIRSSPVIGLRLAITKVKDAEQIVQMIPLGMVGTTVPLTKSRNGLKLLMVVQRPTQSREVCLVQHLSSASLTAITIVSGRIGCYRSGITGDNADDSCGRTSHGYRYSTEAESNGVVRREERNV